MSDKIMPHHLDRKAILYVRQSSLHQVIHNRESQALQYAMRDRLRALGWSAIEVVDDDLGRSAAGTVRRAGFERMVAEVCLGKVGAVAAREVSRFARNSRDWQQLIEMCRVVDTLLVGFVVLDSPLLAYRAPEGDDADLVGTDLNHQFYRSLAGIPEDRQVIVVENTTPPADMKAGPNVEFFSSNPHSGRYGFFPFAGNQPQPPLAIADASD